VLATVETGETELVTGPDPLCGEGDDSRFQVDSSVWYSWTPGASGGHTLSVGSREWSPALAVYAPTGPVSTVDDLAGSLVGCDARYGRSPVEVEVSDPDATYYVQVFGPAGLYPTSSGPYTLKITR